MVNDYFSQAAIDFLLGNVSDLVFDEFESTMMTKDPAISIASMREQAIDTCQRRVIADPDEDLVGGWVMLTPMQPNTVKPAGQPMVEVVLLLTDAALYLCRFDWHVDKVQSFERVDLAHVVSIRFGTYITSTLSPAHTDELTNVGLVVEYQPGKDDVVRTNTRTLSSLGSLDTNGDTGLGRAAARTQAATPPINLLVDLFSGRARGTAQQPSPPLRRIALKAPYARSSFLAARSGSRDRLGAGGISSDDTAVGGRGKMDESGDTGPSERLSEIQVVVTIAAEIERLALKAAADSPYGRGQGHGKDRKSIIEKGDIVSVDEAKKSTGLLEQLGHSLKKMVWA